MMTQTNSNFGEIKLPKNKTIGKINKNCFNKKNFFS